MTNSSTEKEQVRQMTAADIPRAMEIATSLPEAPHWPESAYLDALNPEAIPRRIALVVVSSGNVQGFTVASLLPPHAELELIAVSAGSQRRGMGRMLFDRLVHDLRGMGVLEIVLELRTSNRAAVTFYRSAGFGQTGLRLAYYVDPIEDAVLMRLQLS
ncbi:MAG: GNAT family N-acetyltransferase [Terracidiphilus sp.]